MGYFDIFLQNRMLVETIYTLIIVFATLSVSIKARKLYNLSSYSAIKYFGNAFLSFAIAFFVRFLLIALESISWTWILSLVGVILSVVYYYTISLAGFYLVYSLVWKHFGAHHHKGILLHIVALVIAFLTFFLKKPSILFITQLVILSYAIALSYSNYKKNKRNILQLYFIAMVLAFFAYLANFLLEFIEPFYPPFVLYVYAITSAIFIIFFYGVFKTHG